MSIKSNVVGSLVECRHEVLSCKTVWVEVYRMNDGTRFRTVKDEIGFLVSWNKLESDDGTT